MAKLPAIPPSPLLLKDSVPAKYRRYVWLPIALVSGFLVFFIGGLLIGEFDIALLLGLVAGPIIAYAAVGAPVTRADYDKVRRKVPRTPPEKRPLLFFPTAIVAAALLYFLLGILATSTPLNEDFLAVLALGVALPAAVAIAYVLYGFPAPKQHLTEPLKVQWQKIPPDRRPFLFFPLGLLIAAPLYILFGYALTEVSDFDLTALVALVLSLALGFAAAYRLVGVPKTEMLRQRVQQLPEVPARAKPAAFVACVVLVGALFAVALGGTIGALELFSSELALDLAFPLFLLAGWLLAVPIAGGLFGYPHPRPWREYVPRITAEQRPAVLLPLTLGLGATLMVVLGMLLGLVPLADLEDAVLAAAIAFPLALLISLRLLHVRARDVDPRTLEKLPEAARPLVVLALWLVVGTGLFMLVAQVEGTFVISAAVAYSAGLAVALLLVDRPFVASALQRRRALRRKEEEIEARLRREMGLEAPEAASTGGRFRRRGKGKA